MASYQDSATSTATGANGVTYSYRRMGTSNSAQPLVLLQHFRGNLDNWDPALIDALAAEREVIAFDNVGGGAKTGQVPASVPQMAHGAIAFISALDLARFDLLGYSLGGVVSQQNALTPPH